MSIEMSETAWKALGAGVVYLVAWATGALVPAGVAQLLQRRDRSAAKRVLAWRGWGYGAHILGMALSLGLLYLALTRSILDAYSVGLWPMDWGAYESWLPAVAGLSSAWCGLLWGLYWARTPCLEDHSPWQAYGTPLGTPAHILNMEVQSTILRGAFLPALGSYWGTWAAFAARAVIALVNPAVRRQLRYDQARAFVYLALAADAIAAGCFAVSGNLWVSLVARAALQLTTGLVHRILFWRRRRRRRIPTTSGEQSSDFAA